MHPIKLDSREMEPPEPFKEAVTILGELKPGEYLYMLHRRIPFPLFDFCETCSLSYHTEPVGDDHLILIYHPEDKESVLEQSKA